MTTPTLAERIENVHALILDKQQEIHTLERFLVMLEKMAAEQIAPKEDVA